MSLEALSRRLTATGTVNTIVRAGTYSPSPVSAEIRRAKDNKIFRSVVETDNITAVKFLKHLAEVCEQVEKLLGDECYVYWHGAKYLAENGKLKGAGTAIRKFQGAYAKESRLVTQDVRYGKYPPVDYKKAIQTTLEKLTRTEAEKQIMLDALVAGGVILGRLYKKLSHSEVEVVDRKEIISILAKALDKIMRPLERSKSAGQLVRASSAVDSKRAVTSPEVLMHIKSAFDTISSLRLYLASSKVRASKTVNVCDILDRLTPAVHELQLGLYA